MKVIEVTTFNEQKTKFRDLVVGETVINSAGNLCLVVGKKAKHKPLFCPEKSGLVRLDTGYYYDVTDTCTVKYQRVKAQVSWKKPECM